MTSNDIRTSGHGGQHRSRSRKAPSPKGPPLTRGLQLKGHRFPLVHRYLRRSPERWEPAFAGQRVSFVAFHYIHAAPLRWPEEGWSQRLAPCGRRCLHV